MNKKRLFITVRGVVQGVGFRPFVYKLALNYDLKGWVNNNSEGVYIDIEGLEYNIFDFLHDLEFKNPPLSKVTSVNCIEKSIANYKDFSIKASDTLNNKITFISPDISICNDCIQDISSSNNRRYKYAFTNCTNCGPRFSITKDIPYDREKTTMNSFAMCSSCNEEYQNPLDRRFHAQPNACNMCGPSVWIEDTLGKKISITCTSSINEPLEHTNEKSDDFDPIKFTQDKLIDGTIFAIKGLCGFHIACNAFSSDAIDMLRKRKRRPHKPLALMFKDLNTVYKYINLTDLEESILISKEKPILLINKNYLKTKIFSENIAPNVNTLGIMLPYTPLHHLLFMDSKLDVLVMTSANMSSLPMEYENYSAKNSLSNVVDFFLLHNRDIHIPLDDSIVRVMNNEMIILRKARGYIPSPTKFNISKNVLALGPNMKNTFSFTKENHIFTSQYNGILETLESIESYKRNLNHFKKIFNFEETLIACDLHPNYASTKLAYELAKPTIYIQHHHAHIVSCMVDNDLPNENIIGISFDGTGYGMDNKIWGSEVFICDYEDFERKGHLSYKKLIGSDSIIKSPWKIGCLYLFSALKKHKTALSLEDIEKICFEIFSKECKPLITLSEKNIRTYEICSMGRLFDCIASMLNIKKEISYEGQASIELEALADLDCSEYYALNTFKENNEYIIDTDDIIIKVFDDIINNLSPRIISSKFHNTIAKATLNICIKLRTETNLNTVCLSGGVFQNKFLLEKLTTLLRENSFNVCFHRNIPPNDSGISIGQLVIADSQTSSQ